MQYTLEIVIDQPRARVVELFLDPGNLKAWQPDLVSCETISGTDPNAVGAKTRQRHRMGARDVEMIQTITRHDYPEHFGATYEADNVLNLVENRFIALDDGTTRWVVHNVFLMPGILKVVATLFRGRFRKQTMAFMKRFKDFAESAGAESAG